MLIGYARVSTDDQDSAAQVAALKSAGCERIYREKASGGRWDRPELHRLLDQLRKNDVLVVWKLDRLSRSLRDVLIIMERLGEAKAGFRSLTEAIDTTTPAGRMMMQMVGAFAEFERAMLRERTKAGLDAARQAGRIGGRRPKLSPEQEAEIEGWSPRATRRLPMRRGCSRFIPLRSRDCSRVRLRRQKSRALPKNGDPSGRTGERDLSGCPRTVFRDEGKVRTAADFRALPFPTTAFGKRHLPGPFQGTRASPRPFGRRLLVRRLRPGAPGVPAPEVPMLVAGLYPPHHHGEARPGAS